MSYQVTRSALGAACIAAVCWLAVPAPLRAQAPAAEAPAAETEPAADAAAEQAKLIEAHYTVPEGATAEQLLEFIGKVQQPPVQPKSREDMIAHFQRASVSLGTAADGILTASTDAAQRFEAIKAKLGSFQMRGMIGDGEAMTEMDAWLEQIGATEQGDAAKLIAQVKMQRQLMVYPTLSPEQQQAFQAELVAKLAEPDSAGMAAQMIMRLADMSGEGDEAKQGIALVEAAVAALTKQGGEQNLQIVESLSGLLRRLKLPGNPIELEGTLLTGEPLDWSAYKGKVVLVDFWATWCGPCVGELPNVLAAYEAYHDRGFEVLGISLDEEADAVTNFVTERKIPWQNLFSTDASATGWRHPMAVKYGINAIPRAILVDAEGKVVHMNARGKALEEKLVELLGPAEPQASTGSQPAAVATK